ncbi:hypothetical protein RV11_GL003069 [Enterococcus phoeniculicola]|uniref:HTH tetR-type domain-containing protein n=1 Tax=Enterococcus phoeniculicola ATCC BAA-412 TaxID=1158610 RepID=R3W3G4_9ENTE|nr:TetR/AcrR family transcriptional regulator [Enterococcus phoeniculicola]EOL41981.1 hypothetical protein UC3_02329 [Enterococcus phoeniculicola ATCC BAA-412]EOT79740.1 hypothetical protein I589_01252 [Enterococcus phoeniculicola ATCC BAA-412]OJG67513.1 hypothetical protein RV11_GL003069 [Enterococcus phoeniculicola]
MVRTKKIHEETLLRSGYEFVLENGFDAISVRKLAKYMGYSTKPIYDEFINLNNFKEALLNYVVTNVTNLILKDSISSTSAFAEEIYLFAATRPKEFTRFFLKDSKCKALIKKQLYIFFKEVIHDNKAKDIERNFDTFWYYTLGKATDIAYN